MRVRIDTNDKSLPPLRAGMSVEVDVDTGHSRGLPHFLTAMFGHDRQRTVMSAPPDLPKHTRVAITVCVILATLMQALDTTIANVALPYMQGSVSASQDEIAWVLTSYIVAAAIMTPPTGYLPKPLRTEASFPGLGRRLHRCLDAVRHGAVPGADRAVPGPAGLVRRGARPALADCADEHQSEGAARIRDSAMGGCGDGRPRSRAGARRLADPGL